MQKKKKKLVEDRSKERVLLVEARNGHNEEKKNKLPTKDMRTCNKLTSPFVRQGKGLLDKENAFIDVV